MRRSARGGIGEELRERGDGFAIPDPSRSERAPAPRGSIRLGEQGTHRRIGGPSDLRRKCDVLRVRPFRRLRGRSAADQEEPADERRETAQGSQSDPLQVVRRSVANVVEVES